MRSRLFCTRELTQGAIKQWKLVSSVVGSSNHLAVLVVSRGLDQILMEIKKQQPIEQLHTKKGKNSFSTFAYSNLYCGRACGVAMCVMYCVLCIFCIFVCERVFVLVHCHVNLSPARWPRALSLALYV